MRRTPTGFIAVLALAVSLAIAPRGIAAPQTASTRWDLTDLYPTPEGWEAERKSVADALPALAGFQGTLGKDAASLAKAARTVSDLRKRIGRLMTYASLKRDENTKIAANEDRLERAQLLATDFASRTAFVDPEILAAGQARIDGFIAAEPALKPFVFMLHDDFRKAPHTLGAEAEGVLAAGGTALGAPQTIYALLASADVPWPTVTLSDGQQIRLDSQAYTDARELPNRDDRKTVFDAFFGAWAQYRNSLGATLAGNVAGTVFEAKVRHYPSAVASALATSNVPDRVYRTLVDEAHAGLPTLYRYFALRKKMLGLPDLHYYDMYVPLVKSDRRYSVAEAETMTLAAVAPLGQDYVKALAAGFAAHWMDAMPQPGKAPGAYMNPAAYDVHPFVLANFTGNYDSVTTIAHEWGHAMHTVLSHGAQPFETSDAPIFLAEIASTNNEMLLEDNLIANAKTAQEKLFYLNQAVELIRITFFRQTMLAEFELKTHEAAERGEALTGEALTKIYLDLLKQYHGDAQGVVKIDDLYGMEWAYIPHFYNDFYVYQYATCLAAAAFFSHGTESGDPKLRDIYLGVLKAGGSDYPYDILKRAGLDMASPAPYRALIARMNMLLDQMETLVKA